ncbi:MAG: hypothetical protein KUG77_17815 [Nannocystaceae bacterium]|nr:hypothetical protein [Nannocystaceae bacterium]
MPWPAAQRLAVTALVLGGCEETSNVETPAPDYDAFVRDAYPILLRDCGMLTCHGVPERPFRIYGPGRLRATTDPPTDRFDAVTDDELWFTYQRSRSMLTHDGEIRDSLLLTKPLPGAGHQGLDSYGGAVYKDRDDPSYRVLLDWANGDLWYGETDS